MKKHLLFIVFIMAGALAGQAQSTKPAAYNNGENTLNVGVGLGTPYFGAGYSSSLPVNPTATFERGVTDAISVGGTASFARSKYDLGSGYSFTENAIYFGIRGAYHFGGLIDLGSSADLYGGVSLGYVAVSVSDNQGDWPQQPEVRATDYSPASNIISNPPWEFTLKRVMRAFPT